MGLRWRLQGESLAMVRPIPQPGWRNRRNRNGCPPDCSPAGFMIVELNRDVFLKRFLPELAQRYFGGPDGLLYDVAIIDAANPPQFIYASQVPPSPDLVSSPDEAVHLFSSRRGRGFEPRQGNSREPGSAERRETDASSPLPGSRARAPGARRGDSWPRRFLRMLPPRDGDWWSGIRAVPWRRRWRCTWRRDLLLGFGVLLVLAASMALGFGLDAENPAAGEDADGFCRRGVTRTAHSRERHLLGGGESCRRRGGVKPQVKQYGALIRNEAQRLAAMIEQVLLFAATRNDKRQYQPRPVPVAETIDSAVADLAHLTTANGFTVEKEVAPGLPPVMADPKALGRCLQNLMTNALKYGSGGRWMAIRAQPGSGPEAGEVLITVQDRGQGIEPGEIPHIFEPFYRGNAARASQTHGTGLGLSLAKEAAEAMGGRLTVASRLGEGSAFTLHFPAAK